MTTRVDIAVEQVVHRILRDQHGADAITRRRISAAIDIQVDRPADFVAAVTTARQVAATADWLAKDYARRARGDGTSWAQLAPSLQVDRDGEDPAVAAFLQVAPEPYVRADLRYTAWECTSCSQRVIDTGPYNGHPDDDEGGHTADCARHADDIRAWRARTGWDEDDS